MSKVVSVEEAIASIADGSTVTVCGCENILLPEYLLANLEKRFLETGHPRDLTEIHTCRERMHIASVQRVWRYTLEVLRRCK